MKLGFIGLGGMGAPMAGHLLTAGHELSVWARRKASADSLLAQGARWSESPTALGQQCEIVCTSVTGSADVAALAEQLVHGLAPGSVHIDFSTIAPAVARDLAARYAERGIDFVDAPVSGGTDGARAAKLAIMWGGKSALAERLVPLFACLGRTVVRVGDPGAGQVAKVCNQLVMGAAIEACAEAARLAAAAGVDFGRIRTAMLGGSAASRALEVFGTRMVARDFAPGVEARLHHKDLVIALDAAMQLGSPLLVASTVAQQLDCLMAAGWGRQDTARLLCVLERAAGASG